MRHRAGVGRGFVAGHAVCADRSSEHPWESFGRQWQKARAIRRRHVDGRYAGPREGVLCKPEGEACGPCGMSVVSASGRHRRGRGHGDALDGIDRWSMQSLCSSRTRQPCNVLGLLKNLECDGKSGLKAFPTGILGCTEPAGTYGT